MRKLWYVYTVEYNSVIKRDRFLLLETSWKMKEAINTKKGKCFSSLTGEEKELNMNAEWCTRSWEGWKGPKES